jgi:hypothetical protein
MVVGGCVEVAVGVSVLGGVFVGVGEGPAVLVAVTVGVGVGVAVLVGVDVVGGGVPTLILPGSQEAGIAIPF